MIYISIVTGILFLAIGLFALTASGKGWTSKRNSTPVAIICSIAALLCVGFAIWGIQVKKGAEEEKKAEEVKEQARQQMEGSLAPDFEGVTAEGDTVRLFDYTCKGKYVLLDFWASWCGPCREYLPIIREFGEKYHELVVIGVDVNDNMANALKCISEENMTWPVIITKGRSAMDLYNCTSIPSCYIIDPEGVMVVAGMHPGKLKTKIEEYLQIPNGLSDE